MNHRRFKMGTYIFGLGRGALLEMLFRCCNGLFHFAQNAAWELGDLGQELWNPLVLLMLLLKVSNLVNDGVKGDRVL